MPVPQLSRSAAIALLVVLSSPSGAESAVRWVTGYYAAYSEASAGMPPSEFDYTALTHVIHWPVVPLANGTFDPDTYGLTVAQSAEVVSQAHAVGTKAILGFGGDAATVGSGWQGATSPGNPSPFTARMGSPRQARGHGGPELHLEGATPTKR